MKKTLIILLILLSNIVIFGGIKQIDSYCGFLSLDAAKNGSIEKSIREINNNEEEIETIFFYIDNKNIKVSSTLDSIKNIDYKKENMLDHNVSTAWVEGKKGYGIGEWIEIKLGENEPPLRNIDIYNGYCKDMKTWKNNSRVKKFKLYVDNIPHAILNLADTMECQSFPVDIEDCENKILRFEIVEVYKGDKYEDTAISEILFEYHSCCFPASTLITLSDNSVKRIDQVKSGDEILTYSSSAKKFIKTKVLSVAKVEHDNLIEIDFGDRVITSTDDHPYLSDKGWKSYNPNGTKLYRGYENVKELKVGDKIYFIGENGKCELKEVKGIKKVDRKEMCYTITKLENGDNFIADGAVVGVEERR